MGIQLARPLLRLPRRYCAEALAAEIATLPSSAWLPHPGRLAGNDAVPLITPGGSIVNGFAGPMAPTEHLLRLPYILEILADLGAVWGRSRLMGLAAGATVPAHVDVGYYWRTHIRIHIPIVTTPEVRFYCAGESVHMAAGECWVFDSFSMHEVRNDGADKRTHLVLDTVGGQILWDLVAAAGNGDANDQFVSTTDRPKMGEVAYEQINVPEIMSAWEVRCHIDYLMGLTSPNARRDAVGRRLERFAIGWMAAWAEYGTSGGGVPSYQRLIDEIRGDLRMLGASSILLHNQVPLDRAISELILQVAVPPSARHVAAVATL